MTALPKVALPKLAYNTLSAKQLASPWRKATYDLISWLLKCYIQFRFSVDIQGLKPRITEAGKGFVIACNHSSNWDPPMVAMAFPHVDIAFMAKQELMEIKLLGPLLYQCGTFSVNRARMEKATLKTAKTVLTESTWALGRYP
jgi:1-acyl-sn-glycerol-3-phosphate acyltransferase